MTQYYVVGGEYKDTTFTTLVGKLEKYGPFDTMEQANRVWKDKSMANIDHCMVRYLVTEA